MAALPLAAAMLLAACGGGGDDEAATSPAAAAGAWSGTTSANRSLTALVLGDGDHYLIYSGVGNPAAIGGFVHGTATLDASTLASDDAIDFNLEGAGAAPTTVEAALVPRYLFRGTIAPRMAAAVEFQASPDPDSGGTASLARLAGTYPGQVAFSLGVREATFSVSSTGEVASVINGCSITGTVAPRTDLNAYDLTIVFGGAPCVFANLPFTGVAHLRAADGRLVAAVRNTMIGQGIVFVGTRP